MRYEWTNSQYTHFLNAIDPSGSNPNFVYSPAIMAEQRGGIMFDELALSGSKYSVVPNMGGKPVNNVSWWDAARVANWLHNGAQNYGSSDSSATAPQNHGAYTLGMATSGSAPARNIGAKYYVPTVNEWYKAAYYKGGGLNAGYWDYATQSDTQPTPVSASPIGDGSAGAIGNFANYFTMADWNRLNGNVTTVGTNGGPGFYGTYDMAGNVSEFNDLDATENYWRGLRGGNWSDPSLKSNVGFDDAPTDTHYYATGFRLAAPVAVPEPSTCAMALAGLVCGGYSMWRRRKPSHKILSLMVAASCFPMTAASLTAGAAHAVTIDWVTVGDPGNAADTSPSGYGASADSFRIMKFEFTNLQYTAFLNAVDPSGSNPFSIYNDLMGSNVSGGITNTGTTNGSRYVVKTNMGDKPVNYVSWFDAARVANWLQNGQGSSSTETGVYTLVGGQTSGTAPARNSGAQFYIPTENQWYKAAYYKGGGTNAGYWDYATQSDTTPTAVAAGLTGIGSAGSTGNFANYNDGANWNGQNGNVTTVGTNGSASAYGAFDMSGSVWEWNDLTGSSGQLRGVRGGGFASGDVVLPSSFRLSENPDFSDGGSGFRLAAVPEPSTYAMALAGLACGGYTIFRRRKRA
jgi:sulfatase modifying factor 1